jgi:hypothetical protein
VPRPRAGFKDATGAVARQAARFRIFGFDRRGRVVREVTEAEARITWSVSIANKQAFWYDFDVAMDLPIARPVARRSPTLLGDDRAALVIAPGPRRIDGRARGTVPLAGGSFLGEAVSLGDYERERTRCYGAEHRFPASPFWDRRRARRAA